MFMMCKPTKTTILLLITVLLLTSMSSAFGVVYCDSGCFSAIHHKNHHNDESHEAFCEDYAVAFDQLQEDCADSCLDFTLGLGSYVIKKELVQCPPNTVLYLPFDKLTNLVSSYLYVYFSRQKSPPEISQTILAHRKIVLLI